MAGPKQYLVVYDISMPKERYEVSKILEGFGFRVQESVFECRLSPGGYRALLNRLKAGKPESGFVVIYRLNQQFKPVSIGGREKPDPDQGLAFVV